MDKKISESVINRLPRYYRYLSELENNGSVRVSSKVLSEKMRVTASQIRQDLNCFGGFGQQGYGYNVEFLKNSIAEILGITELNTAILVGVGNMGRAFVLNTNFEKRGFKLIGIFDTDPDKVGTRVDDFEILDYNNIVEFVARNNPTMAILTVPKSQVNNVAKLLVSLGIKAFLNFSYAEIAEQNGISVENIHLGDSLMRLSYKINAANEQAESKAND